MECVAFCTYLPPTDRGRIHPFALSMQSSTEKYGRRDQSHNVLITGSTDGIGAHTARNMASQGWRVFVHGREPKRCAMALDLVKAHATGPSPELIVADLSDADGVVHLANEVEKRLERVGEGLDVLINNAGVFEPIRKETDDGIELTLAVNVLAPMMLSELLWPSLKRAASLKTKPSRIVNVSSISHMDGSSIRAGGTINWDDLESKHKYDGYGTYGLSKLLLIMVTFSLALKETDRLSTAEDDEVMVMTLDPGTVNTKMLLSGWGPCGIPVGKADDETWAALSSEVRNGKYYVGRRERRSAAITYDKESRLRAWSILEKLIAERKAGV